MNDPSVPSPEPFPSAQRPELSDEDARLSALFHDAANRGGSVDELLPLVYDQLRMIAKQHLKQERVGHTLQATALVHEAYARLLGDRSITWQTRSQFFHTAAIAMRRILIDHARSHRAAKRGGNLKKLDLASIGDVADLAKCPDPELIMRIDGAISRLQVKDPRAAQVVWLRFYGGLSLDETAATLAVSSATVERDWQYARAWLVVALGEG